MAVPGLGTGINKGFGFLGRAGKLAGSLASDYAKNPNMNFASKLATGGYTGGYGLTDAIEDGLNKYAGIKPKSVRGGIGLARRPEQLHGRIELKPHSMALVRTNDTKTFQSYVEEID
jgi:hypothetical protein